MIYVTGQCSLAVKYSSTLNFLYKLSYYAPSEFDSTADDICDWPVFINIQHQYMYHKYMTTVSM